MTLSAVYANLNGPTGLPLITSRITIEGNGAAIHRAGNAPAFRLMAVTNSGDLTLQSMILSGGSDDGVLNRFGALSIKNSTISGNGGNGVSNIYGTSTIENSTVSNNGGGGVFNWGDSLTIANSTISGNTSTFGAGLYNYGGVVTIENSTISGNRAFGGAGIYNTSSGFGSSGFRAGSLTITNSTISGNSANSRGGGLVNSHTCPFGFYCGRAAAALTLNNSLIAGNQAAVAPEIENDASSIVTANNFNLFGSNGNAGVSGFTPGPIDIVASVPVEQILGPLQNNGGPTQTHALLAGSPALDAGDPGGCRNSRGSLLSTDQRGFARHVDGNNDGTARCDIGAVELNRLDNIGMAINVSPSSGSGPFQTFSFTFFDPNGFADLFSAQLLIHSSLTAAGGCDLYYHRESHAVWLQNDSGSGWIGPSLLGSGPALQNGQCTVSAAGSSVSGSGSNLTLNLALAFTSAFSGSKNIYALAYDTSGLTSDWQQEGTWIVPGGSQPPAVLSVIPSSGSGSFQTFSFGFFDPNGFANIFSTQVLIHSSLTAAGGCDVFYHRESNAVWLQNDSGSGWIGPSLLGSGAALQNSQCTVSAASSSAFGSGSNLTLNLALAFTSAFSGSKNIYAFAYDNEGLTSNWQQAGTWTVPGGSQPPAVLSVIPSSGSGSLQTFSFTFFDPNGFANVYSAPVLINSSLTAASGCFLYYHRESNAVWLQNDSGSGWIGPTLLGSGAALQNGQCTVGVASSSALGSGSNLTLNLALAFASAFSGSKNIYAIAYDNEGLTSNWQQTGTWTVR